MHNASRTTAARRARGECHSVSVHPVVAVARVTDCILHFACCIADGRQPARNQPPAPVAPPAINATQQLQYDLDGRDENAGRAARHLGRCRAVARARRTPLRSQSADADGPGLGRKAGERGDSGRRGGMGLSVHDDAPRERRSVEAGVLHGDLLVVGGGDPAIGGRGGDDFSTWVDALKTAGIHRVDGRVDRHRRCVRGASAGVRVVVGRPRLLDWRDLRCTESRGEPTGGDGYARRGRRARRPASRSTSMRRTCRLRTAASPARRASRTLLWPEMRPGETTLTIAGSVPVGGMPATLLGLRRQSDCVVRADAAPASDCVGYRRDRACR